MTVIGRDLDPKLRGNPGCCQIEDFPVALELLGLHFGLDPGVQLENSLRAELSTH